MCNPGAVGWSGGTASESRREPVILQGEPFSASLSLCGLSVMVEQGTQDRSGRWAREMQPPEPVATVSCDLVVL